MIAYVAGARVEETLLPLLSFDEIQASDPLAPSR
jgi:hypothetical protein